MHLGFIAVNSFIGVFGYLTNTWISLILVNIECGEYIKTRRSGRYTPILLAPVEGWGALHALLGAFGPSSVGEGSKQNILNLVSK